MSFSVELGDITKYRADAIVNAANTTLLGGGGVDGAIHRAAGPGLLEECRGLHGCPAGGAKITKGYRLPAAHVIHTPGPVWRGGNEGEDELLASCYRNCLRVAEENGCRSVAFPSISTGAYRFPLSRAAGIAVREIAGFLASSKVVRDVTVVCLDAETKSAYEAALARRRDAAGAGPKREKSCGAVVAKPGNPPLFLVIRHNRGHWAFPKGHVEGAETEEETARREIREETGLAVELDTRFRRVVAYSPELGVWKDVVYFLARPVTETVTLQASEIQDSRWCPFSEALKLVTFDNDRNVLAEAERYLEGNIS